MPTAPLLARPRSLNHIAYPTWDTAATTTFYTETMGCQLVAAIQLDAVPSTGEPNRFLHTFFAFDDDSCIAFFDVEGLPRPAADGVPRWIRHLALNVATRDELDHWRQRLADAGLDPVGITDHDGIWESVYVFDPNDIRLELTWQRRRLDADDQRRAAALVDAWCGRRTAGGPQR